MPATLLDSRIDTVTLYDRGATILRVAELSFVGEPPREVEVAPLPLALVDATVRVRLAPIDPNAREDLPFVATHVHVGLYAPPRPSSMETPERIELRKLLRAVQRNNATAAQIDAEIQALSSVPVPPRPSAEEGKPPPPSPTAARLVLDRWTDDAIDARVKSLRALRLERERLEEEARVAEEKLRAISSAREVAAHELRKSVTASLRRERDGAAANSKARLLVEYFIPGARWAPAYQARIVRQGADPKAEIAMRALVSQRTGEDWRGVKVVLSTASPIRWSELPEPTSIRIGKAQPSPRKAGFRPPPAGAQALFADFDRDLTLARAAAPLEVSYAGPVVTIDDAPPSPAPIVVAAAKAEVLEELAPPAPAMEMASFGPPPGAPIGGAGGFGPPPPMQAMAPMAYGAPAPPPAPAPAAGPPQARAMPARKAVARDGAPAIAEEASDAVVYTSLRLPPASDGAHRSRLRPRSDAEAYAESLARLGAEIRFDPRAIVAAASTTAMSIANGPLPAGAYDVRQAAGVFDYAYRADATIDVPSDGTFHSVAIGVRAADVSILHVVVPREDTNVYRQAVLVNPLAAPLLAGPAEVYVDGEYVLGTTLPNVAPRGEFRLGLGVEQAIKCARNTRFEEARAGTKAVLTHDLTHAITIEIVNHLPRAIACEVRERVPVPAPNAEVAVEEIAIDPPWEAYDQSERGGVVLGGRRWKVRVESGKSATLRASYVAKIYGNSELVGGNRREA